MGSVMKLSDLKSAGAAFLLVAGLCLGGCGENASTVSNTSLPEGAVVVSNFDYMGHQNEISFSQVPERTIVARPEVLDALIALHAEQSVCAAYITKDRTSDIPELQKLMPNCRFFANELDRETALMLKPDFIIGWRWNFRKGALGNVDFWNRRKVATYIEENSGPVPAVDPFPPSTVESEIQFLQNMGTIYHREEEAGQMVEEIRRTLRSRQEAASHLGPRKAITIEFMGNKIEVFGDKLLSGDIIRKLGCSNYNYEIPFITGGELRMSDADTIFIIYHGSDLEAQNALDKLSQPEFKDIPAVKAGRIHFLPYRYICASNIYTAQCIREIYKGLYE